MPARAIRSGRWAISLAGAEADAALAPRHQAHDALHRGGLAGAVAAQQRHHLAFLHVEPDPVQHVALAVPGVQALTSHGAVGERPQASAVPR